MTVVYHLPINDALHCNTQKSKASSAYGSEDRGNGSPRALFGRSPGRDARATSAPSDHFHGFWVPSADGNGGLISAFRFLSTALCRPPPSPTSAAHNG